MGETYAYILAWLVVTAFFSFWVLLSSYVIIIVTPTLFLSIITIVLYPRKNYITQLPPSFFSQSLEDTEKEIIYS